MADGALAQFNNEDGFAAAVMRVRAESPFLANNMISLCRGGMLVDQALGELARMEGKNAADTAWWRGEIQRIRGVLNKANLGACRYSQFLFEQDPFEMVRARGSTGTLNPPAGGGGRPLPPLPLPTPPANDHDHDDDDDDAPDDIAWKGGDNGGCGDGCCNGGCADKGGCGWNFKWPPGKGGNPCIFDAAPMKKIDIRMACAQPGRANCEPVSNDVAPCQISEIVRKTNRWRARGSSALGTIVDVPADEAHDVPAGMTLWALEIPSIQLSAEFCLRDIVVSVTAGAVTTVVEPDMIGLEPVKLYSDPQCRFVRAYDWPSYEDPEYIRVTDGRCACSHLCVCVPQGQRVRVLFLIPTGAVGDVVTVVAKGKRRCFGILCGDCPPGALCGRTLEPIHVCIETATPVGIAQALVGLKIKPADMLAALVGQFGKNKGLSQSELVDAAKALGLN